MPTPALKGYAKYIPSNLRPGQEGRYLCSLPSLQTYAEEELAATVSVMYNFLPVIGFFLQDACNSKKHAHTQSCLPMLLSQL